jgi:hypothetical protein
MLWYTLGVGVALSLLVGMGIWSWAYRSGLKKGRTVAVPFRLIDELLDHRIDCLRQDPALARVEICTLLGIDEGQSQLDTEEPATSGHDLTTAHVYH